MSGCLARFCSRSSGVRDRRAPDLAPSLRRWFLITAEGGGSNGSRLRLSKFRLQEFADETGLARSICHFPPDTSKWNKIEHRFFSFISSNRRGDPLRDYEAIVKLIAKTTTAKGLKVRCRLDRRKYPTGRRDSDEEMKRVNLKRHTFFGGWAFHRSTSPSTISTLPRMTTTSAINWPRHMSSSTVRLIKLGGRTRYRYGFGPPSLMR